jgi:DNA polymerase-3 subunit beta
MIFVATDGRRLAMMDADLEFPESSETEVIIPNKAIQELQRLAVGDGKVEMKLSASQASFTIADTLVVSKLIEGNYPNYRQVIPADPEEKVEVDREHLFETVRRISLLASDKTNSVKLAFRPGEIEVSVDSPDVGAANEKIDVPYDGKEMQIAFNPEFLMAPLRSLDSQTVVFNLIDEMSPGVIRVPSDTGGFLYVLMPMRVSG